LFGLLITKIKDQGPGLS